MRCIMEGIIEKDLHDAAKSFAGLGECLVEFARYQVEK